MTLCWVVAMLLATPATFAQSPRELAKARELVISADRAEEQGEASQARELLRDAFELSEEPELIYRVATLDEELENPARAIRHYRLYLKLEPDSVYRERIEARIERLDGSLEASQTWVIVETVPGGAHVYVGKAERVRCIAPCKVAVDPGESKLVVQKENYATETRMVFAARGETKSEVFDLEAVERRDEPELALAEIEEKPEEVEDEARVVFEVDQSQIDYVRSGPPSFIGAFAWTSLLAGFWSLVLLASPALPDATTALAITGATGTGLGGYLLFVHPWSPSPDPAYARDRGVVLGVGFGF